MPVSLPDIGRVLLAALALLLPGIPLAGLLVPPGQSRGAFLLLSGLTGLAGVALTFWLAARVHASLTGALAGGIL